MSSRFPPFDNNSCVRNKDEKKYFENGFVELFFIRVLSDQFDTDYYRDVFLAIPLVTIHLLIIVHQFIDFLTTPHSLIPVNFAN